MKTNLVVITIISILLTACAEIRPNRNVNATNNIENQTTGHGNDSFAEPDTPIANPPPSNDPPQTPAQMSKLDITVGTIGDSISRGFNARNIGEEGARFNWSTGSSLTGSNGSHSARLKSLADSIGRRVSITTYNEAAVGAEAIDTQDPPLSQQANRMSQRRPDYVTILIGDNDICQTGLRGSNFKNVFKARVKSALKTLTNVSSPPKLILLSSLPNPQSLKLVNDESFSFEYLKCQAAWRLYCPNMENLSYSAFRTLWQNANKALKEAADESDETVVWDDYEASKTVFRKTHVSDIDCFHPSVEGQRLISNTLWRVARPHLTRILKTP